MQETFHAKKGYKLAHTFYINIATSEYNFLVHLINVICMKTRLGHQYILYEN